VSDRVVVSRDGLRVLVDPDDPDRKVKPPVVYTLSPEEIQARYGHIKGSGEKLTPLDTQDEVSFRNLKGDCEDMKTTKITKIQLIDEVREHGTSKEGVIKIATKYGLLEKEVYSRIAVYKIKDLLQKESAEMVKTEVEEEKKHSGPGLDDNRQETKHAKLRPTQWHGNGRIYSFREGALVIEFDGGAIEELVVENLNELIDELQEIRAMREAG
jgi:hypothetical protein